MFLYFYIFLNFELNDKEGEIKAAQNDTIQYNRNEKFRTVDRFKYLHLFLVLQFNIASLEVKFDNCEMWPILLGPI